MQTIKQFFSSEDRFAGHCGIVLDQVEPGTAKASMRIEPYHLNGARTVHGGAIFTLADFAFAVASNSHGTLAMGITTSVSFVKAAKEGTLYAEAQELSRNAKLATYLVQVTDDAGALIASFQGTVYRKKDQLISVERDVSSGE